MSKYSVSIRSIQQVTHDVLAINTDKPDGYQYTPGQATDVAINKTQWTDETRPFTFTGLPTDDFLAFTIKTYPSHNGVTNQLLKLAPGDELLIGDSWGAISYKGPGLFIAGGAGITPFIAIFRQLQKENRLAGNRLLFANKKKEDIILHSFLENALGKEMISILSDETLPGHHHGFITKGLLKELIPPDCEHFYICGPPPMMASVMKSLKELGVAEKSMTIEL
jgi:ferredoxin-NADP reductase